MVNKRLVQFQGDISSSSLLHDGLGRLLSSWMCN